MSKIIEIRAPKTLGGESVTEGIIKIKKNIGEAVKVDDLIFEIETDKTALELTAEASGQITEFLVKEDDVISPDQLLAKLAVGGMKEENKGESAAKKDAPSARKIMEENAISAESVKGTGMGGRVTKADVIDHMSKAEQPAVKQYESPKSVANGERREERVKMSKIRQVIAARLKASQNTAAILTTFNEIDMKNVMDLRAKYKETFEKKYGIKLGFMSFFIKAAVQALKEIREINAEISGDEIIYKNYYDIGVAVGTDKGLVVPVIRNADQMSFAEIELTLVALGKKAREGKLQVSEMEGATFTISNGGVYGSLLSTPIINPPQSGILGMHSIQNRPVAVGSSIEIRPMMYIALSYDHRIVDGKGAVTFLVKIKNYIEDPNRLILEI
ncbi:2-oxoglutarate dehydrogenase complex dihydrolipoyllysine-residue succinyltransferase [Wolbachia endosymbiont of Diaphorina citri]|jgi:2-oxoglutarate dehydrogenase complex dihydrolipoamide succinyltransferase (E2 component)|uniref:2-oxoglutarate dehydrogenase complex dihydrolipoyllysine-residue succinyltransferase n=1 Tax=Wolbachia endosymbiont of Diaphorina citri TaxID=116598 RepID=UPI00031DA0C6|nr:2-oxoglutarate dehydrogenase complex dihydrolipoyllysine-residue succinyltransferase [Wolbachia endosymbiont of Diaphorina citri]QJT94851.1 2-oxoglutarate dehydrogenase complex dihydrolipoyllysine-residue succinyltransferase [Wolbachia endosymbiont of Diaphorina citri]QJT96164.1 2-oxoglutarate dehydrogenase complex dihydrolipoyllysine-residue succinyltransferase [Wolbachia endosymbiont of Diaphorina citri]QLK11799.1 2-oxoglutarate dehydrogenase complex dihydrolipoyllysine-residue succinyltran